MAFMIDSDLPGYIVRINRRAKRAKLKVSPIGQVEVVVPINFDSQMIPILLGEHRQWLENTLSKIARQRFQYHGLNDQLPRQIVLAAIDRRFRVFYQQALTARIDIEQQQNNSLLCVSAVDQLETQLLLQRWLTGQAKDNLIPLLRSLAGQCGFSIGKISIRAQKTRWGSCSSRKNISINRALLFLSPALVRYVLIHELCHTVHLNHSRHYWQLVEQMEPDYRRYDKALRDGWQYVPMWAYPQ